MSRRRRSLRAIPIVLRDTLVAFLEDGIGGRGAALSYYVLLSLGPLLALIVGLLGFLLSDAAVQPAVAEQIERFLGSRAAEVAETVMTETPAPELISPASVLTVLALAFGATAVFANLRASLNEIWGVGDEADSVKGHVLGYLRTRARAALTMGLTGVILAISFTVTTASTVVIRVLEGRLPFAPLLVQGLDAVVSVLVIGALFGALFRILPAVRVEWSSIWVGAFVTSTLFVIGKTVISSVIASSAWTTYYGPGAAVVAFLFWVYLSAQLFFFGAEFTQVWSGRRGGALRSDEDKNQPGDGEQATATG